MFEGKYIKNCRLCGSSNLNSVIDFGELPLGNNLQNTVKKAVNSDQYPLQVLNCKECNHFQLSISGLRPVGTNADVVSHLFVAIICPSGRSYNA